MGRRGPLPKPDAILRMRSSKYAGGKYRAGKPAVVAPPGKPPCPRHLSKEQRAEFRRIVNDVAALGVLSVVDGFAIERLCTFRVRWRAVEALRAKTDPLSAEGKTLARLSAMMHTACAGLEQSLGLTPSARQRLEAPARPEPEAPNSFAEFLQRSNGIEARNRDTARERLGDGSHPAS